MKEHIAYLGLGSNLGDKHENLKKAIRNIGKLIGEIDRQSAFYTTEPWGFESKNSFLNACVKVKTNLSPHQLLESTQRIERAMGRKEKSHNAQYHDRLIDIDILLYDDIHVNEPGLIIPHPLMEEREFVMVPLKEILGNGKQSL